MAPETSPDEEQLVPVSPATAALILFTSGSTGDAKAVPLTHAGLIWLFACKWEAEGYASMPADGALCFLPCFHVMGLCNNFLYCLWAGVRAYALRPAETALSPELLVRAIEACQPAVLTTVPIMLQQLAAEASRSARTLGALRSLRHVLVGGAQLSEPVVASLRALGVVVRSVCGATEVGGSIMISDAHDSSLRMRPYPGVGVAWRDESATPACSARGRVLVLTGARSVTPGYLCDGQLVESRAHMGGVYDTNDVFVEEGGLLLHACRADELLVHSTGEKTNPVDVERALRAAGLSATLVPRLCVFGTRVPRPGLVVELPADAPAAATAELLLGAIERANAGLPSHSALGAGEVIVLRPAEGHAPLPLSQKGAVLRHQVEASFGAASASPLTATDRDTASLLRQLHAARLAGADEVLGGDSLGALLGGAPRPAAVVQTRAHAYLAAACLVFLHHAVGLHLATSLIACLLTPSRTSWATVLDNASGLISMPTFILLAGVADQHTLDVRRFALSTVVVAAILAICVFTDVPLMVQTLALNATSPVGADSRLCATLAEPHSWPVNRLCGDADGTVATLYSKSPPTYLWFLLNLHAWRFAALLGRAVGARRWIIATASLLIHFVCTGHGCPWPLWRIPFVRPDGSRGADSLANALTDLLPFEFTGCLEHSGELCLARYLVLSTGYWPLYACAPLCLPADFPAKLPLERRFGRRARALWGGVLVVLLVYQLGGLDRPVDYPVEAYLRLDSCPRHTNIIKSSREYTGWMKEDAAATPSALQPSGLAVAPAVQPIPSGAALLHLVLARTGHYSASSALQLARGCSSRLCGVEDASADTPLPGVAAAALDALGLALAVAASCGLCALVPRRRLPLLTRAGSGAGPLFVYVLHAEVMPFISMPAVRAVALPLPTAVGAVLALTWVFISVVLLASMPLVFGILARPLHSALSGLCARARLRSKLAPLAATLAQKAPSPAGAVRWQWAARVLLVCLAVAMQMEWSPDSAVLLSAPRRGWPGEPPVQSDRAGHRAGRMWREPPQLLCLNVPPGEVKQARARGARHDRWWVGHQHSWFAFYRRHANREIMRKAFLSRLGRWLPREPGDCDPPPSRTTCTVDRIKSGCDSWCVRDRGKFQTYTGVVNRWNGTEGHGYAMLQNTSSLDVAREPLLSFPGCCSNVTLGDRVRFLHDPRWPTAWCVERDDAIGVAAARGSLQPRVAAALAAPLPKRHYEHHQLPRCSCVLASQL